METDDGSLAHLAACPGGTDSGTRAALKPNHKAIQTYYETLRTYADQHVEHEGALETAFSQLLHNTAKPHGWTLIP